METESTGEIVTNFTETLGEWQTRHFRTSNQGVVTALYQLVDFSEIGRAYLYEVKFGFCSPKDIFCKKKGRLEAFDGDVFYIYRFQGQSIDSAILGFLTSYVQNTMYANHRDRYYSEQYFKFPRWLECFLFVYKPGRRL